MHTFFSKKPNGKLKDILIEADKSSVQVGEAKQSTGEYPFFTSGSAILKWDIPFINGRNCFLNTGGNADVKFYVGEAAYSTDTWCISTNNNMSDYLYLLLVSIKPELNQKFFQGTDTPGDCPCKRSYRRRDSLCPRCHPKPGQPLRPGLYRWRRYPLCHGSDQ